MQKKTKMPNFVVCSRCGKRYNAFILSAGCFRDLAAFLDELNQRYKQKR
jgi:ribosomal protein L32